MFDRLASNLEGIFTRLRHKGSLRESDIDAALREVRAALLEADVALSVAREFVETVRERSRGAERLRGVNPAQQVIKLVHDHLVETLGSETTELDLAGNPPVAMMLVGLQGSGKTTTTAKIGRWLQEGEGGRKSSWPPSMSAVGGPGAVGGSWRAGGHCDPADRCRRRSACHCTARSQGSAAQRHRCRSPRYRGQTPHR